VRPSVCRIVHYRSHGTPGGEYTPQCRAAVVSEVDERNGLLVGLVVLNPTGLFFHALSDGGCHLDPTNTMGGTWHWPERVD
jgi:hypothetical protein